MEETLLILEKAGYVQKYAVDGNEYGLIPTFKKHQRISIAEQKNLNVFPLPPANAETFEEEPQTDDKPFPNGFETASEPFQNTGNRKSEIGDLKSEIGGGSLEPSDCDLHDPKKLFLHLWQHTPNIFNCVARIESPKDFDAFWKKSNTTCDQVKTAIENFVADVHSGSIPSRYIPSTPDRFVLKGWIQKCQKHFSQYKTAPPGTALSSRSKKTL
jgi:hypothetical protein